MNNKLKSNLIRIAGVVIAAVATWYFNGNTNNNNVGHSPNHGNNVPHGEVSEVAQPGDHIDEAKAVAAAHDAQRSKVWVTVKGEVIKTLRDDTKGSQHQRFLIRLSQGPTLLIAHNIDLAQKVPLQKGDTVWVRGRYEWNNKGGVLHWTHHDPKLGRKDGPKDGPKEGWIDHQGKRYE